MLILVRQLDGLLAAAVKIELEYIPELAMQYAMMLPMNQAQTAVAGPPEDIGAPKVAGTEPSTPRMEMAYETVDHLEKCL
jgi:hypothetical protein